MWLIMAVLSAVFAGLTTILAKCGIKNTDSDVATAIRTIVVLLFSWVMVFVVGSANTITDIEPKSLLFLILSGMATGLSWICYFKALSMADVNKVVPIDKSSTILTVILAIVIFGETHNIAVKLIGTAMIAVGVFMMIEKKDVAETTNKKRLVYICCAIRRVCGSYIYIGKGWNNRSGIKSRHGNKNGSGSSPRMGNRIWQGQT